MTGKEVRAGDETSANEWRRRCFAAETEVARLRAERLTSAEKAALDVVCGNLENDWVEYDVVDAVEAEVFNALKRERKVAQNQAT